mgnify:CR=1 FL=1
MMEEQGELKLAVSVGMKVQFAPFQMAEAALHLSGISPGTTAEEIEEALDTGRVAYDVMKARLVAKLNGLRESAREEGWY